MARRNWAKQQATSRSHAMELCIEYARDAHNLSVEQIAERMGTNRWTLYKYVSEGNIPADRIRSFEHACECHFAYLTRYLCHSAHLLAIKIPTGRKAKARHINDLQAVMTETVSALLEFGEGKRSAEETLAEITQTMETLGWHHANVSKSAQPELEF